jgi:predicted ATPase
MHFNELDVFCGMNGTGKSSVFDAIRLVRDLALGNCFLGRAGDESKHTVSQLELCKWLDSDVQEFELEFEEDSHTFLYQLHIQQVAEYEQPRILKEAAFFDGELLFTRDLEHIQLGKHKTFSLDRRQSALSVFQPENSEKQIKSLQQALSNLIILRPNARIFETESRFESRYANLDMGNIISWYRFHAQDPEWTDILRKSLQMVWSEDFRSLRLSEAGNSIKQLEFIFSDENFTFGQLSDGEKMLAALYMIHAVLSTARSSLTVLIDEPDNFISIQELQPWMLEMMGIVDKTRQLFIISHNAEILEITASNIHIFHRDNHRAPARIKPLKVLEGLTISEALARGWIGD